MKDRVKEANYWQRFCHRRQKGANLYVDVKMTRKGLLFNVKERSREVEA